MDNNASGTCSSSFYSRLFARLYDPFMNGMERQELHERRKALLSNCQGTILEVGAGTGANLPLYPAGTTILAAEPSPHMIQKATENLQSETVQANLELIRAGVGDNELDERVQEGSLDAVVATLVLCTVDKPKEAIDRFYQWLKPCGQLIVLEHIKAKSSVGAFLQNMATPVWKYLAEGCHLNRPTDAMMKESGFILKEEEYFSKGVPFYQTIAQKPKDSLNG
jgi:ubiquinone/menaquinone biosynthesis C-methylase UbiE